MSVRPTKIVMASGNAGKIRELSRLLSVLEIKVVPQTALGVEGADEAGTSFHENSLIKALHAAELSGLPAIADDSGLSVDALDGAPGVYSARYAGPESNDAQNNAKLIAELETTDNRGAAFHCVATFVVPGEKTLIGTGEWRGEILRAPQGTGGFGYDRLFYVPDRNCSSAELTQEEKNARSHRGQALRELVAAIQNRYS